MLLLFTDFGYRGPYVGQMHAAAHARDPSLRIVDLMHDAPKFNPRAGAYLLDAVLSATLGDYAVVAVVDPGVGTRSRVPVWLEADGRFIVGPDNGLLDVVARRSKHARKFQIEWSPAQLSASFHGRDLFVPVAVDLCRGIKPAHREIEAPSKFDSIWRADLPEIIYIDEFGSSMTGLRARGLATGAVLDVGGQAIHYARTFGEVPGGQIFWYANSLGMVEIAANKHHAADALSLRVGDTVGFAAA